MSWEKKYLKEDYTFPYRDFLSGEPLVLKKGFHYVHKNAEYPHEVMVSFGSAGASSIPLNLFESEKT